MKKYFPKKIIYSLVVFLVLTFVSYYLVKTYNGFQDKALNRYIEGRARSVVDIIEKGLEQRFLAIDRMALRHQLISDFNFDLWKKDALEYRQDISGIHAIGVLAPNLDIQWLSPNNKEIQSFIKSLIQSISIGDIVNEVKQSNIGLLTKSYIDAKGRKFLNSLHPTFTDKKRTGYVIAVYPISELFSDLLDHSFHVTVHYENEEIYSQVKIEKYEKISNFFAHNYTISIRNAEFSLSISPSIHLINKETARSSIFYLYLIFLLVSLSGGVFTYLQLKSKEDLLKSKNLAEKALKTRMNFFSNMSHEIRTPLNGVLGINSFLMDHEEDSEKKKHHQVIEKSGKTLLALINDILDFSRLEINKITFQPKSFNLIDLIKAIKDLLSPIANEKGLLIQEQIGESVPQWIISDPARLRQILTNLIGNSIKFSNKGSIDIIVEKKTLKDMKEILLFSIHDKGIGIPKDKVKTIFNPFSQVNDTPSRAARGTGLGLAISKNIVTVAGGRIWVEDTSENGTTICFELPYKLGHKIEEKKPGEIDLKMGIKHPMKVLVAEDDSINREVVKVFLKKLNYNPDFSFDGKQVLEALKKKSYDMILMDCHMPIMDGFEATREVIKRYSSNKRPVIIALTASAMSEDREKCVAAGMDDFIAKPLDMMKLIQALQRVIDKKSST